MKNFKKLAGITLSLALAASAAGCTSGGGKSSSADNPSDGYPLDTDVTLTYFRPISTNISSFTDNVGNTEFAKELDKRTGVKIEYIHAAAGQDAERLSLMIASNDLPDIISKNWLQYKGGPAQALNEGVIIDLGEYREYAPNYFKILDENKEFNRAASTDEGAYYGFVTIQDSAKLLTVNGPAIRQDWLDELGISVPETIDEWTEMLRAFKTKKSATAPFSFNYGNISVVFGMFEARFDPMVKGDKVVYGPAQPEFKRALTTLNEWFKEGLLDKNIVSVDASVIDSQILNGQTGATVCSGGGGIGTYQKSGTELNPSFSLCAMPFPTYEKGGVNTSVKVMKKIEGDAVSVTTACKTPKIATKVLDYLYSDEGNILANFGTEGKTFNYVDGKPVYTDLITNNPDGLAMAQALGKYVTVGAGGAGYCVREEYIEQYYGLPQQQLVFTNWAKTVEPSLKETVPAIKITADESEEYSDIMNEVSKYRNQMIVKFITGVEPLDKFDEYVETMNKYGLERAMELQTNALDRYNK